MRKALLMVGALLTLTSGWAMAAGIDLNWNACKNSLGFPSGVPASNKNSTCLAITGSNTMIASYYAPASATNVDAIEAYVDYKTSQGISCWWDFRASNALRAASLTVMIADPFTCGDGSESCWGCPGNYFSTKPNAAGGGGMVVIPNGNARISCVVGIPIGTGSAPSAGEELAVGIRFNNAAAPVASNCPGCSNPACFTLNRVTFFNTGQPGIEINTAQNNNTITWQGGAIGGLGCPATTPTQSKTWGSVKALYR